MKTSCLHTTLLLLFLLGGALPEKQCKDNSPIIQQAVVKGNVSVLCPIFTTEEMTFILHSSAENCAVTRNFSIARHKHQVCGTSALHITHQLNPEDNSTKFVLYNVTTNQTGLYTCTAKKIFPPPLLHVKEEPQTIVIVQETHHQNSHQCEPHVSHLSLWVGLGVLTIYGLIITSAAFSLRFRLTKVDLNQHDYMNMRPRARRRNQGPILHPTRSWYCDNTSKIVPCKPSSKQMPS
ncbi:uncharacterized protein si:dkey-1h24.6 [Astyanax mexicanus]|uniref:uncharacterized protein si:dkey-1h24.6 n=1 Tax=Astyanax mexicanus TaxID=7994 RepID=UPI0020CAFDF5|nr:uncharacterized protein si:dkey-1h24.6 [Astyanax mexicanus]